MNYDYWIIIKLFLQTTGSIYFYKLLYYVPTWLRIILFNDIGNYLQFVFKP